MRPAASLVIDPKAKEKGEGEPRVMPEEVRMVGDGWQRGPGSGRDLRERILLGILLFTGVAALVGGALLTIQPDGTFLQAKLSALSGTPFRDWRIPGILLATLVGGGGGVGALAWLWARGPRKRELIALYALGLIGFETVEWTWIGPQALEVVFGMLALAMLTLAFSSRTIRSTRSDGGGPSHFQTDQLVFDRHSEHRAGPRAYGIVRHRI
jgi:hypothetical protein